MTAEFNITIPGAEIIKRLADLETQVRDLANEQTVDKARIKAHTDNIARLIDEVAVLKDLIDGKIVPAHRDDLASASRVERIAEELADLRRELNLALANGYEETKIVNERLDRHESLIADLIERSDRLTDFVNGKTTRTPEWPHVMPEPPVDTLWHPFNFSVDLRPDDDKRVVIMTRDDVIAGPEKPSAYYWGNDGDGTIVAWRYAKAGE